MVEGSVFSVQELSKIDESKGLGIVAVDRHKAAFCVTPLATLLIRRGGLRIEAGRIKAEDPAQRLLLENKLDAAWQAGHKSSKAVRVGLRRLEYGGYLYITINMVRLRDTSGELHKHQVLLLRDVTSIEAEEVDDLATAFGLTRREGELACHLAKGARINHFAAEHSLSLNTVKSHLKEVFRKTGVHNRVQLVVNVLAALR